MTRTRSGEGATDFCPTPTVFISAQEASVGTLKGRFFYCSDGEHANGFLFLALYPRYFLQSKALVPRSTKQQITHKSVERNTINIFTKGRETTIQYSITRRQFTQSNSPSTPQSTSPASQQPNSSHPPSSPPPHSHSPHHPPHSPHQHTHQTPP